MNIKELKNLIKNLPDETPVVAFRGCDYLEGTRVYVGSLERVGKNRYSSSVLGDGPRELVLVVD